MSGALERGIVQLSPWSQAICRAVDVGSAGAARDSRIAIDSYAVGLAVPADRYEAHALSAIPTPRTILRNQHRIWYPGEVNSVRVRLFSRSLFTCVELTAFR
jgi:hypothetical protein